MFFVRPRTEHSCQRRYLRCPCTGHSMYIHRFFQSFVGPLLPYRQSFLMNEQPVSLSCRWIKKWIMDQLWHKEELNLKKIRGLHKEVCLKIYLPLKGEIYSQKYC